MKFDGLSEYRKQKIVKFFFKLGFNSFDVDKKYRESQSGSSERSKRLIVINKITNTNNNDLQQDSTFRIIKTFPGFQKPGQRSIIQKIEMSN